MVQLANRRMAMTLFSDDTSPYCHMVRIVLAEKGISFELERVDPDNTPDDLKDLNPYNEVPTLIDRELVLFHPYVIMEYLDERFPHPPLMPVDPVQRGQTRLMMQRIMRDWYSLVNKIVHGGKDVDNARKELRDSLISISPLFDQKSYFLSDEFSMMECALIPLLWRLPGYGIEIPSSAKGLSKYTKKMFLRASFKASMSEAEKDMEQG